MALTRGLFRIRAVDAVILLLGMVGSGLLALYLGKDVSWDLLNYHFYNPYALLHKPTLHDVFPADVQSYHNPLLDIPGYLLIRHLSPRWVGFLIGAIQGVNFWLLYRISFLLLSRYESRRYHFSLLCALAGFLCVVNVSEIGTFMGDNLISIMVLTAMYLLLCFIAGGERIKILVCSGFLLGIASGLKWTAAIYAIGALAAVFVCRGSTARVRHTAVLLVAIGFGVFVSVGHWSFYLWKTFQNPVFPYFNGAFPSLYLPGWFRTFINHRPSSVWVALHYPIHLLLHPLQTIEIYYNDLRMVALYLSLPIFSAGWPIKRRITANIFLIPAMAWVVVAYVSWMVLFPIQRYLIVLEMMAPALILAAWRDWSRDMLPPFLALTLFFLSTFSAEFESVRWGARNWGRGKWEGEYFGVRPPHLKNLAESVIVVGTFHPISYAIPYFPASTRFVRIASYLNLVPSGAAVGARAAATNFESKAKDVVRAALSGRSPLYIIYSPGESKFNENRWLASFDDHLAFYGVRLSASECVPFEALPSPPMRICPLVRSDGGRPSRQH